MKTQLELIQQATDERYRQLATWRKAAQELTAAYATPEPDAALLRAEADRLRGWADAFPDQQGAWVAIEADVTQRYDRLTLRYESLLRERCAAAGYWVTGRSPELLIEGLVKVQLDTRANQARVNGKRVAPMALVRVVETIATEIERLWARPFDAGGFLARLRQAHALASAPGGGPTPIKKVYDALAATDSTYRADMFAADLAQLEESGLRQTDAGAQLVLAPTRDMRQAVWVVGRSGQDGRYVGLIDFKTMAEEEAKTNDRPDLTG